jgi:hypothetical protein
MGNFHYVTSALAHVGLTALRRRKISHGFTRKIRPRLGLAGRFFRSNACVFGRNRGDSGRCAALRRAAIGFALSAGRLSGVRLLSGFFTLSASGLKTAEYGCALVKQAIRPGASPIDGVLSFGHAFVLHRVGDVVGFACESEEEGSFDLSAAAQTPVWRGGFRRRGCLREQRRETVRLLCAGKGPCTRRLHRGGRIRARRRGPWVIPFFEDAALPASVTGPLEC